MNQPSPQYSNEELKRLLVVNIELNRRLGEVLGYALDRLSPHDAKVVQKLLSVKKP